MRGNEVAFSCCAYGVSLLSTALREVMSFESKIMKGSGSQLGGAAHTDMGAGPDNSVDRVRAAGMRYCMLGSGRPCRACGGNIGKANH